MWPMFSYLRRRRSDNPAPGRGDAVVLMYHSISDAPLDPWRLHVGADRFAEHLEVIHRRFRALSLRELSAHMLDGDIPPRSVVVTFDDGYRDNLTVAKPLLEDRGVPATVFVTTQYVGSARDFWWEELETVCALLGLEAREEWDRLQPLGPDERESELDRLWDALGRPSPAASSVLTRDELAELAASPVIEIGAHTLSHPRLAALLEAEQRDEIEGSRRELEAITGTTVRSFSYPHGDFSPLTTRLVHAAGLTVACTTRSLPVTPASALLELPRVQALDWDAETFTRELDRRLAS
jgi:peptidoglycan/xylan/chitin deacetylase (PgdA/CDA1 family)